MKPDDDTNAVYEHSFSRIERVANEVHWIGMLRVEQTARRKGRGVLDSSHPDTADAAVSVVNDAAGAFEEAAESLAREFNLGAQSLMISNIGPVAASVSRLLHFNKALLELSMPHNAIGDEGARLLARMLEDNTGLRRLSIPGNFIGPEGAIELSKALANNRSLESLNLGSNELGDKGTTALSNALHMNTTLTELMVNGNGIGVKGIGLLRANLKQMLNTSLTYLNINDNPGTKDIIRSEVVMITAGNQMKVTMMGRKPQRKRKVGAKHARIDPNTGRLALKRPHTENLEQYTNVYLAMGDDERRTITTREQNPDIKFSRFPVLPLSTVPRFTNKKFVAPAKKKKTKGAAWPDYLTLEALQKQRESRRLEAPDFNRHPGRRYPRAIARRMAKEAELELSNSQRKPVPPPRVHESAADVSYQPAPPPRPKAPTSAYPPVRPLMIHHIPRVLRVPGPGMYTLQPQRNGLHDLWSVHSSTSPIYASRLRDRMRGHVQVRAGQRPRRSTSASPSEQRRSNLSDSDRGSFS